MTTPSTVVGGVFRPGRRGNEGVENISEPDCTCVYKWVDVCVCVCVYVCMYKSRVHHYLIMTVVLN